MSGLLLLLAAGLAVFWTATVAYVAWMLSHPPRRTYAAAVARGRPGDPAELGLSFESWSFRSRGMDLPVWDIPGRNSAGPVVILTHGWADSRIGGLLRVPALLPHASRIVLWDLPGHGEAPGVCRLGTAEVSDLAALLETLDETHASGTREPRPLVLWGWSLGAGVSLVIGASNARVSGVIAESPYRLAPTPARNVLRARALPHVFNLRPALATLATAFRAPALLFGNTPLNRSADPGRVFDRAWHAARVRSPVLVLHGAGDEVCPLDDGRAIADAAPHGRLIDIPDGRHNDLWTDPGLTVLSTAAVRAFLEALAHPAPLPADSARQSSARR